MATDKLAAARKNDTSLQRLHQQVLKTDDKKGGEELNSSPPAGILFEAALAS
jgi:hypothetical protein